MKNGIAFGVSIPQHLRLSLPLANIPLCLPKDPDGLCVSNDDGLYVSNDAGLRPPAQCLLQSSSWRYNPHSPAAGQQGMSASKQVLDNVICSGSYSI